MHSDSQADILKLALRMSCWGYCDSLHSSTKLSRSMTLLFFWRRARSSRRFCSRGHFPFVMKTSRNLVAEGTPESVAPSAEGGPSRSCLNLVRGRLTVPNIESRCNQLKLGHPPGYSLILLRADPNLAGSSRKAVRELAAPHVAAGESLVRRRLGLLLVRPSGWRRSF
jgi:hypothetical protein